MMWNLFFFFLFYCLFSHTCKNYNKKTAKNISNNFFFVFDYNTQCVTIPHDYHTASIIGRENQSHKMLGSRIITSQRNFKNSKNVFIQNFIGNQGRYEKKPFATTKKTWVISDDFFSLIFSKELLNPNANFYSRCIRWYRAREAVYIFCDFLVKDKTLFSADIISKTNIWRFPVDIIYYQI